MADDQNKFIKSIKRLGNKLFEPKLDVARSWLLIFVMTLLAISLLGVFFPALPVGAILFMKIFGAAALGVGLTTGILSLSQNYERVKGDQSEFSIFTYVKEVLPAWLRKSNFNIVQFAVGVTLFFVLSFVVSIYLFPIIGTTLLSVLPGVQPLFDIVSAIVTFFQAGFNVSMITSPLAIAVFLGVAVLAGYDFLCRVIKAIFPVEGENKTRDAKNNSSLEDGRKPTVDPGTEVLLTQQPNPATFPSPVAAATKGIGPQPQQPLSSASTASSTLPVLEYKA